MSDKQPPKHQVIDWNPTASQGQGPKGNSDRNKIFATIAVVSALVAVAAIGLSWRAVQQEASDAPVISAEEQQELAYKSRGRAELAFETASQAIGAARNLPISHEGLLQEIALIEKAFLLAETQLKNGNYAAAGTALESVIVSTEVFTETVEMQQNANKRYDDLYARLRAAERYKGFSVTSYDTAYSSIGEGRHLLESGSFRAAWQAFDEASDTLDDFEARKKEFVTENLRAGQRALKNGDGQAAELAFQTALKYDSANEAGLRGLERTANAAEVFELLSTAKIAEKNEDFDRAIADYDRAFGLDEFSTVAQQGAARARADQTESQFNGFVAAAEAAAEEEEWSTVISNYEQALEVDSKRDDIEDALDLAHEEHHASMVHNTLSEAYDLEREYEWDKARLAYEDLLDLEPDYEEAIEGLIRVGRTVRALLEYEKLLELSEQHLLAADYQSAIRRFNEAMQTKPSYLEITPEAAEMRRLLEVNSRPVDITFVSDTKTWVSITNFRMLGKIKQEMVSLPPGDYEVIGRRKNYQDVMLLLKVRPQMSTNLVSVICKTRADS